MTEQWQFVLSYYKTYPTFDVLGTHFAMARSKAHENLHTLSPLLYDTLVHLDLMPYRELSTPEALKAALQGGDRLLIDATERAYHRSQDAAKQREHDSGKKPASVEEHGHGAAAQGYDLSWAYCSWSQSRLEHVETSVPT